MGESGVWAARLCWQAGAGTKEAGLLRPLKGKDVSSWGSSFACKSSAGPPLFFEGKQKDVCVFVGKKASRTSLPQ